MSALIEQSLADGFRWLRFPALLEAQYNRDTAAARLRVMIVSGTLVAFVMNLFLIADFAMVNDVFSHALALRTWLFTPITLVGMWVMSKTRSAVWREWLVANSGLLAVGINVYLCLVSQSVHALAYLVGLSAVIIYVNVFPRLHFWVALPFNLLVLSAFCLAVGSFVDPDWALVLPIALVLLSTMFFSLYHLYVREHDERHSYLTGMRQRLLSYQLSQANAQLERASRSDALTQVANRRHFDEFLAQLWDRARQDHTEVSLLMLDVDHFKLFNDHHGHPAGDACLVQVAQSLQRSLRRPGDLVARYGGEEFVAVLSRTADPQARAAAERVRSSVEALAMRHAASPTNEVITVSVGVATLRPADGQCTPADLIKAADQSLYQAKNRGRNRAWPPPPAADEPDAPSEVRP